MKFSLVHVCMVVALGAMLGAAVPSRAAFNAYLIFTDSKGNDTKTVVGSDGSFKTKSLGIDVYSWSWGVGRGISAPSGTSTDPASKVKSVTVTYQILDADVHSGLSTGKRQHDPIVVTKSTDMSSPNMMKCVFQKITIDKACAGISGTVVYKDAQGKVVPMTSWDVKTNTK